MSEFTMPSLGADMDAGTLVEWMKKPGERVQRGDVIAAVETQKGAIEIEVFETGVLERILVDIGQRVPVGTALAIIRAEGEVAAGEMAAAIPPATPPEPTPARAPPSPAPTAPSPVPAAPSPAVVVPPPAVPPTPAAVPVTPAAAVTPTTPAGVVPAARGPRFTPAALRRAQELGLDLSRLQPAADGIVGLREVEAAVAVSAPLPAAPVEAARVGAELAPAPARVAPVVTAPAGAPVAARAGVDFDEMRKAIAAAMARSWREIPHYFVSSTLDMTALRTWLQRENAQRPPPERLHYAVPLIKAVALALRATPSLNGHNGPQGFTPATGVHLGIAIAMRGGGLIAPALIDTDQLALPELMARLNDLVARVRGGRLRSSEMSGATATLTNLGEETADALQPVIYPPQVAIIGCGQIAERPWARDDALSIRRTMTVTVGGDHRVSDGRIAASFLRRLDELLQQPERL